MMPADGQNANDSAPFRADPVNYWAVQGLAGVLNILSSAQKAGMTFADATIANLRVAHAIIGNMIAVIDGKPVGPLPTGATGPLAEHIARH